MKELPPWRIRHDAANEDVRPARTYLTQNDEVQLSEYWHILGKHRLLILVTFLLAAAIGAYFLMKATTLYTATALLKIEPQHPQISGVTGVEPLVGGATDYYPTQFALLSSRRLAAMVIGHLNLESNKTFTHASIVSPDPLDHIKALVGRIVARFSYYVRSLFPTPPQSSEIETNTAVPPPVIELKVSGDLINRYLQFINISPIVGSRLVRVQFTTPDPTLSQMLANAHVEAFIRLTLESRFNLTKEAREFLGEKILELRGKLEQSEAALNDFRRAHGIISVERGENIVVDRLLDLNRRITATRAQRIEAEALYRTVENKDYQDLADVMRQGLVPQLKGDVARLEAEKARVSTIFKAAHPRIQELTQQIAAARDALNDEIANVVRGIRSSYSAALAQERALQEEAEKQQKDALKLKELAVEFTVLQGEVTTNRSLYENVLKRLSETNVASDIAVSNVQIAEFANRPQGASGPNASHYLLGSMALGLLFGVGLAFVREYLDSTVATPEDVQRSVGLSTFGAVPHFKFLNHREVNLKQIGSPTSGRELAAAQSAGKELIANHSPFSVMSESYRTIRTSLLLSQADKPPQVVLLTSPSPREGKTTTTLNLGIALAQDGYSVLVVDGDMRKGCCHARLGLRNNTGLSNVLTGRLTLEEAIQPTCISGLSLLSRGIVPPNPTELLGSIKMREVLYELRSTFQFVLIDSPPTIAVSDASVLSVVSDGVLLIFDGQNTSTPSAQKAVERLDIVHARLLGVVLNGVNLKDPHYSYYRLYSSYDSYSPSNDTEELGNNGSNRTFTWIRNVSRFLGRKRQRQTLSISDGRGGTVSEALDDWGTMNTEDTNESSTFEPILSKEQKHDDSTKESEGSGTSPYGSLQPLVDALTEAIGPVARLVIEEKIATLGESLEAFPESRIDELVKLIDDEIAETQRRVFHSQREQSRQSQNRVDKSC